MRVSDGKFRVLSDRTQAPSGAGYALENRIVLNRVLPTIFADCNVHRLAPFFISIRKMLASLPLSNRDNPRVVLLTPGPYNETYFEHAYLARYLGYSLVQGNDLTVRDCRVYLKTLGGLQRVDVILRRVDDSFCDPLELYRESYLGVPGLVQAVREGTVAIANAIGTGVLQAPAFLPFLPSLCRHLLGEELQLPSVQTWWCGEESSRAYVLENLSRMVIKPAFPTIGTDPIFAEQLSQAEREGLAAKLCARPEEFVAQENVAAYTSPVLLGEKFESRLFVVRSYLTASGDSYSAMAGALTRVTASPDALVVSLQKGGGSKDTWILADGPVSEVTLLATTSQPLALSRGGSDLPSRVADDLFWLGRYVERADALVRLSRVTLYRLSDPNSIDSPYASEILGRELLRGWAPPSPGPGAAWELAASLLSPSDPSGLRIATSRARELARVLRDRISNDVWRVLQSLERDASENTLDSNEDAFAAVMERLNRLVVGLLAFGGMAAESMTRGHGWRFLDMGMRIERGLATAYLLRATLLNAHEDEAALLDSVLEVADSSLTYRRRYLTRLEAAAVADLLLADETNPRAIAFQIAAIDCHLGILPRESVHPQAIRIARSLCASSSLSATCGSPVGVRGQRRPPRPRLNCSSTM